MAQAAKKARIEAGVPSGGHVAAKAAKASVAVKTPKAPKAPKAPKLSQPAAPAMVVNELICKRVQRFWPDEGGWFDAIITGQKEKERGLLTDQPSPLSPLSLSLFLSLACTVVLPTPHQSRIVVSPSSSAPPPLRKPVLFFSFISSLSSSSSCGRLSSHHQRALPDVRDQHPE